MEQFLQEYGNDLVVKTTEHLYISFVALFLGILVAVPLGIALTRTKNSQHCDWLC